jgi:hypothetical protein
MHRVLDSAINTRDIAARRNTTAGISASGHTQTLQSSYGTEIGRSAKGHEKGGVRSQIEGSKIVPMHAM